ncbi:hypothetical protein EDD85DRAFT_975397 [Armillaria nabsnona]|nr:hypothetical protein EDD85DRAFT_975397 [Armillaria nabsnona]
MSILGSATLIEARNVLSFLPPPLLLLTLQDYMCQSAGELFHDHEPRMSQDDVSPSGKQPSCPRCTGRPDGRIDIRKHAEWRVRTHLTGAQGPELSEDKKMMCSGLKEPFGHDLQNACFISSKDSVKAEVRELNFAPRRSIVFRRARPGLREEMALKDRKEEFKEMARDARHQYPKHPCHPLRQRPRIGLKQENEARFCADATYRRPASKVRRVKTKDMVTGRIERDIQGWSEGKAWLIEYGGFKKTAGVSMSVSPLCIRPALNPCHLRTTSPLKGRLELR